MLVVIGVVVEVSTDITTFLIQFTAGDPVHGYKRPKWNNYRCGSTFTAVIGDRSSDIVIYSASTHTHSLTQKPRSRHTHTHTHTRARSLYGHITDFVRVCCVHDTTPPAEFVVVKWFAPPNALTIIHSR